MPRPASTVPYTCARCLQSLRQQNAASAIVYCSQRTISTKSPLNSQSPEREASEEDAASIESQILKASTDNVDEAEQGAMSRRLEQATEDALFEGGKAGRRAVEDAGFSEELKAKLLEKVEASKFRSENVSAFAELEMTSRAGQGTRDIASATPWMGNEEAEDAVLRMLDDAHKPLRPGLRGPARGSPGMVVDLRPHPKPKRSSGERLANARDRTSIYTIQKDAQMSEKEREDYRKELKERFQPGARPMPSTITGLRALANERIEDAIARGQFKNIPRGKDIKRDTRSDNPFIDTTEYILNKMIQRQDIVPPWIEKQQELVKTVNNFRGRMRHDWKRHVARTIASRGGSLQDQVKLANLYAASEKAYNSKARTVEQISVSTNPTDDPATINVTQDSAGANSDPGAIHVTFETKHGEVDLSIPTSIIDQTPQTSPLSGQPPSPTASPSIAEDCTLQLPPSSSSLHPTSKPTSTPTPLPQPFRDANWERTEFAYFTLAITNLNTLTRTYNLMAPDLAKKPYYTLSRELASCYSDVAPLVASEIIERASRPAIPRLERVEHKAGGVMERFGMSDRVRIVDERRAQYGFKEFWRDLWDGARNIRG